MSSPITPTSSGYSPIDILVYAYIVWPHETKHETEYGTKQHRAKLKAFRSLYVKDARNRVTRRTSIAPPSSFPRPHSSNNDDDDDEHKYLSKMESAVLDDQPMGITGSGRDTAAK
jgi:hypothetical protein